MKNKLIYVGLGSVMTLVLTVTTITFANNPGDVNACVHKTNGNVRIIDNEGVKDCSKNELPLSWNAEGIQGPEGPIGVQGEEGPTGPQGEPGESNWDEERIAALEQRVLALEEGGDNDDDGPYDTSLTLSLSNNNPDATTLIIEEDDTSDEYPILIFEGEAGDGGPLFIEDLAVRFDTEGESYSSVLDDAFLTIDGNTYDIGSTIEIDFDTVILLFEGVDTVVSAGEVIEIEFSVELQEQDFDNYSLGQTIQASVISNDYTYWQVEGYDDLIPLGSAVGSVHTLNLEPEEE